MRVNANELGLFLKQGRLARGLTLRAVEEASGISNAYLSQLESGRIQRPSPAVLHKLCALYVISYAGAMKHAGYPVPNEITPSGHLPELAARLGPTTAEEEEALVEYLQFLRSRRKRGA